jgi:hypothetical protein
MSKSTRPSRDQPSNPAWLTRFRTLALSLPEANEEPHFDRPSFRVRKKIFATLWEPQGKCMVKLTPEQQDDYVEAHPDTVEPVRGIWGAMGATLVNLTGKAAAKPTLLRELLTLAWRNAAPKRIAAQLESAPAAPRKR